MLEHFKNDVDSELEDVLEGLGDVDSELEKALEGLGDEPQCAS